MSRRIRAPQPIVACFEDPLWHPRGRPIQAIAAAMKQPRHIPLLTSGPEDAKPVELPKTFILKER
jgi:hypothetical protein